MIPKKIHYCWFGNNKKPKLVKKCIKSWKKICPDYEIVEWNERNYDVHKNEFISKAYELKKWAFVSDYARIDIVNTYGGIYLDTDVELLKNLDFLLEKKAYFGFQQKGNYVNTGLGFGSESNNEILINMLKTYDSLDFNLDNMKKVICPYINTNSILEFGFKQENITQEIENIVLYESKYLDPLATTNDNLLCKDSISMHHYSASWKPKNKIKMLLIKIIGKKNIIRLKKIIKRREKDAH